MLTDFINDKLHAARYRLLEDGTYYGEIPGIQGVWANADDLEACRTELKEVLEDWVIVKLRSGETIRGLKVSPKFQKNTTHA